MSRMCCFSGPVKFVGNTRIFARPDGTHEWLAYSMQLSTDNENAMVLPLPTPPGSPDDAVEFVNLEDYPTIFDDIEKLFPALDTLDDFGGVMRGAPHAAPQLKVVSVGAFEASFVPTRSDFGRLDPRFRLPDDVWGHLPAYHDWGFAVFKLKPGDRQNIHPMAFRFPLREGKGVFFPTLHIHDGSLARFADFDHTLYLQGIEPKPTTMATRDGPIEREWERAVDPPKTHVDLQRASNLVRADTPIYKLSIMGPYLNEDTYAS